MAVALAIGCGKKGDRSAETASEAGDGATQATAAARRPYVISRAGVRFAPPPAWDPARVDVMTLSGEGAAALKSGADFAVTFDYKAEQPAHHNRALLNIYVFPKTRWQRGSDDAALIDSTGDWVFVASVPDANPYREGLLDADQFEAMRLSVDEVRAAFSIENGGPADATLRAESSRK
jgi:hypothetical protein